MKKFLALLLAITMVFSLVACASTPKKTEVKKNEYVMSEDLVEGSVIDGVMTDIQLNDPILQKTTASWQDTCVLYEVNVRQFTEEGTFKAFEKHLDRLKDMGINTLWFMPIHPISETERKGTLGSYYAVDDYTAVNPEFGTMEDFQHLVDKAHKMGFKVIIDWVANHTGWDHDWITAHPEWYDRDENGEIIYSYDDMMKETQSMIKNRGWKVSVDEWIAIEIRELKKHITNSNRMHCYMQKTYDSNPVKKMLKRIFFFPLLFTKLEDK